MTKMLSVTQYVHLMMLKRFNIYELNYKRFVASAVRFQREPAHSRFWLAVVFDWFCRVASGVDTQFACRWNLVASRVVRKWCWFEISERFLSFVLFDLGFLKFLWPHFETKKGHLFIYSFLNLICSKYHEKIIWWNQYRESYLIVSWVNCFIPIFDDWVCRNMGVTLIPQLHLMITTVQTPPPNDIITMVEGSGDSSSIFFFFFLQSIHLFLQRGSKLMGDFQFISCYR